MKYFRITYIGRRENDTPKKLAEPIKAKTAIEAMNKFIKEYPMWVLHEIQEIKLEKI